MCVPLLGKVSLLLALRCRLIVDPHIRINDYSQSAFQPGENGSVGSGDQRWKSYLLPTLAGGDNRWNYRQKM